MSLAAKWALALGFWSTAWGGVPSADSVLSPPLWPPRQRTFEFTYQATVTGLPAGRSARIWVPIPPDDADQRIAVVKKTLPDEARTNREPEYGNRILYVQARADAKGETLLSITYRVDRREVRVDGNRQPAGDEKSKRYLLPDSKVPISGKPQELLRGRELPREQIGQAKAVYDLVNGYMRYDKRGAGWGQGDAVWACDNKRGNCSDFHSLFISLARSLGIPAKFEMGFSLPPARGEGDITGYHCWAKFQTDQRGWVAVDISEANKNPSLIGYYFGNLTEDRVAFSTGRDIRLEPRQQGESLNYFIYPYVEVDGRAWPAELVHCRFHWRDMPSSRPK
jgi:transglutaminase-like putative cysteine protease